MARRGVLLREILLFADMQFIFADHIQRRLLTDLTSFEFWITNSSKIWKLKID